MGLDDLTEPEKRLWDAFPHGGHVDLEGEAVRAEVIRALLLGAHAPQPGQAAALDLTAASVSGRLDLDYAEIPWPIRLRDCVFDTMPTLQWARLRLVNLEGSTLPGLNANGAKIDGHLWLDRCAIDGTLILIGTHISGELSLSAARLVNSGDLAMSAFNLTVDNGMFFRRGFTAEGEINLRGARIGGALDMDGAHLINPGGTTLSAFGIHVGVGLLCRKGFIAEGVMVLSHGHIGANLELHEARLVNPGGSALRAGNLTVDGHLFGRAPFTAEGEVHLNDAHIQGGVHFEGAQFSNPDGVALSASGITVGSTLDCCEGFTAHGEVRLTAAKIASSLCFAGARLVAPGREALTCWRTQAAELRLDTAERIIGEVGLQHARIGVLRDNPLLWPDAIGLDGLVYDAIDPSLRAAQRTAWLQRDPWGFRAQPYEQLASVYRGLGRDYDARTVLLSKRRHRLTQRSLRHRALGRLHDLIVGYGYRPGRAVVWLVALMAAGSVVFAVNRPIATDPRPPDFNPVVYTLDVLLPLVDLGLERAYQPHGYGQWLAWGLIAAGWILATAVAAGITRALSRQ